MTDVTFTKLFSSITESTVWCESDQVRIVWITMLAMANKNGYVFGSVPGLANRARVPVEATREAISKFQQPDIDSRTKEFEGRRIEEVDGGWRLLNYAKHRAIRDEEERRDYMKNLMREKRAKSVSNVSRREPPLSQAEAEAEAEADSRSSKVKVSTRACRLPESFIPEERHYELAKELGINCEMEFQKFRDYFLGLTGPKAVKRDWPATLRNWFRNSLNYGPRNGGKPDGKSASAIRDEKNGARLDRFFSEEDSPPDLSGLVRKRAD